VGAGPAPRAIFTGIPASASPRAEEADPVLDLSSAVALSVLPGALGPTLLRTFLTRLPAPPLDAFRVDEALREAYPPDRAAAVLGQALDAARPLLADLKAGRRRAIVLGDPVYPDALAAIPDPPPLLWINGGAGVFAHPTVAIVGSRYAAPASLEIAFTLARDLAALGVVVASGLARGVDEAAHRGALEGGATVAVLGSGIDRVYPPEHGPLANVIASTGAIVSELAPDAPPIAEHFPRRNRIISGLARGVVVVEASLKSGSLITARLALEQGREVMAVPGSALGGRHKGSHSLIRDGAALVESAEDVLAALGWQVQPSVRDPVRDSVPDGPGGGPGGPGGAGAPDPILAVLEGGEAVTVESLVAATGLPTEALLAGLSRHEVTGRVMRLPGGAFRAVSAPVVR
jgi:DNA processing protein